MPRKPRLPDKLVSEPPRKRRLSVDIDDELLDEIKDFVAYQQKTDDIAHTLAGTVSEWCERGLANAKAALGMDKVPKRNKRLLRGRRMK